MFKHVKRRAKQLICNLQFFAEKTEANSFPKCLGILFQRKLSPPQERKKAAHPSKCHICGSLWPTHPNKKFCIFALASEISASYFKSTRFLFQSHTDLIPGCYTIGGISKTIQLERSSTHQNKSDIFHHQPTELGCSAVYFDAITHTTPHVAKVFQEHKQSPGVAE